MPSNGPGFKSAISYYSSLKHQFIRQCEELYRKEEQVQVDEMLRTFKNDQYNRFREFKKAKDNISDLENNITTATSRIINSTVAGDTSSIASQLEELRAKYQQAEQKATEEIRQEYMTVISKIRSLLSTDDEILQSIQQLVKKSSGGITLEAVQNEYLSYIARQITKRTTMISQIFDLNQAAIAGYYQEATEANAMNQIMSNFGMKAIHAGTLVSKATKRETPVDIVLGKPTGGKKLTVRAMEEYDKMLEQFANYKTSAEATMGLPDWESMIHSMNLKTAGIQSKLYTINFSNPRAKGYGIGSRADLLKEFYKWQKNDAITQALSAEYFNESRTAIIEAFGPTTLLFRTGSQRFFIDELLKELQENDFSIAFNTQATKKTLTAYVIMTKDLSEEYLSKKDE